jgi:3-oxoacyl-[acyl-carrier protein] reductase
MDLAGHAVIVTGAGRGLGRELGLAFASAGADTALFSRSREPLLETEDQARREGARTLAVAGDVTDPEQVQSMVDRVMETFGRVDVLVNNAAIIGPPRFLEDADPEAWRRIVETNLNGPCFCARAVLPRMLKQGRGRIINVSSGLARMAFPRFSGYCSTKAGLEQMTRCLAEEFSGTGVLACALDPGVMDTPMQEKIRELGEERLGSELFAQFRDFKHKGMLREPSKVAELAVHLASAGHLEKNGGVYTLSDMKT